MSGLFPPFTISPFVADWLPRVAASLPPGAAGLDLAMGEGRHACAMAAAGIRTFGVDRSVERLQTARCAAATLGLAVEAWAADLDSYPLPPCRFDVLLCTRFLVRARWEELRATLRPGGFVLYETFAAGQASRDRGPRSPDHILRPGELRAAFAGWSVVFDEEVGAPDAFARLVARKPGGTGRR